MSEMSTVEPRMAEIAPSEMAADEPTFARLIGMVGFGLSFLGIAAVIANAFGPKLIGPSLGYFFLAIGQGSMLYHSLRDTDRDVRRGYTFIAYFLLALFLIAALGAVFVKDTSSLYTTVKKFPFPIIGGSAWAALPGLLGLGYLLSTLRNETEEKYRNLGFALMLGIGGVLAVGSIAVGVAKPDTLVGPGLILSLLGLAYLLGFISQWDTNDGPGYLIATLIGVLGGAAFFYALGRAILPPVLFEGPAALKDAYQSYDKWKVLARGVVVLICLLLPLWSLRSRKSPGWLRAAIAVIGIGFAGTMVIGAVTPNLLTSPPPAYLVPSGLLLMGIGLIYLSVSLAVISDNVIITMIRRELASYFFSPIAYFVFIAMASVAALGYAIFLNIVFSGSGNPIPEPMLQNYWGATMGAIFSVIVLVPSITMRSLSEEKKAGTLEMLLTAPISETAIVFSKFVAAWLFYMFNWLPLGLYLIGLRVEGSEESFDYLPLLSYYLALGVCGAGFIAMGLFFSSLTHNQIIAFGMTCAGMIFLLLTIILKQFDKLGASLQTIFRNLDFYSLWLSALSGQLPLTSVFVYLSLAAFWLYLTIKVLEARKWS